MARDLLAASTLVLSAAMGLSTRCQAAEVLATPSGGWKVDVTAWGEQGLPRVRVIPSTFNEATDYTVTDSIVAAESAHTQISKDCNAEGCRVFGFGTKSEQTGAGGRNTNQYLDIYAENDQEVWVKYYKDNILIIDSHLLCKENSEGTFWFPRAERFYGIPEHAVDLSLKDNEQYRLMNLDVFHYKLDDGGGIYGSIPFLMAHGVTEQLGTTGILWLNSADTSVQIMPNRVIPGEEENPAHPMQGRSTHWISQAGKIVDVFFMPGPVPSAVQHQHASLTGPVYMPPLFSLGYHQCRWNYRSSEDSLDVDNGFDVHNIPYDVLWLDIEHTDGKKYFTWDLNNFPEPKKLVEAIAAKGRKMVTITDPHIKREGGYHVHDQATANGYYVKNEQGNDFEGHCWPGTSSWVDFYNKKARDWYATLFKYDSYMGSTPDLYSWIDMNEPSVFNAHEVTMDRNLVHNSESGKVVKHVELHNMYGFYHTMAAFEGHLVRNKETKVTRPFILTRSFFAGSQRYAAMWTGDNKAEWGHLVKSMPMLLTLAISNFPFAGADVGGFFFNPPAKLMVRWYQAGIFYPFFRGHAHLETKRREPWLFGEENTKLIRNAIALRYSMMPYLYGLFHTAHTTGGNVIRPLIYEFPFQSAFLDEQKAFMFGDCYLVRPITEEEDVPNIDITLPSGQPWYQLPSGAKLVGGQHYQVGAGMEVIPLFLRGGKIAPSKQRLRRSTAAMKNDPLTLTVGVNDQGNAAGFYYEDDGISYDFESAEGRIRQEYTFSERMLSAKVQSGSRLATKVVVERIVILGLTKPGDAAPKVAVQFDNNQGRELDAYVAENGSLVIRAPNLPVDGTWTVGLA